jgi:hypothetical protein
MRGRECSGCGPFGRLLLARMQANITFKTTPAPLLFVRLRSITNTVAKIYMLEGISSNGE